jgi:endonuclease/exonuclease/phosphatase family metal-dependent hydrolase
MRRDAFRTATIVTLLLLAAWVEGGPPPAHAAPAAPPVTLRVMNLNIFYGGDELNLQNGNWCLRPDGCPETLAQVIEAIRAANPDVVGLEEAERNTRPIAEALGWHYSERMQIVSRYPLIDPPGGDGIYIFVQLSPGRVAALANVHLPSDPYGPYLVRDGAGLQEILDLEASVRLPAIQDQLRVLPGLAARGIPVFLTGDFNSPSHLDWTAAVDAVRDVVRYPIDWPVSRALANAGFRDSYRVVHPDPVAVPGFTWTPGGPESIADEVHDRIDWVLAAGPAAARASTIVGEVGNPDVGVPIDPYPTDHRGVISTFDIVPGEAPILVAVGSRRVFAGEDLSVVYHAPGRRGERVAIVPAGGAATAAVAERPIETASRTDGTIVFATAGLVPGAYEAALVSATGGILARSPFWLYAPGTPTEVVTSKDVYAVGEPIGVSWRNAPGMRWDWLGIFSPGEVDSGPIATTRNSGYGGNGHYELYIYTRTAIEGSGSFGPEAFAGYVTWPLKTGTFEIRLLLDDGYRSVASLAPFKVVQP